ncbi:patched domain-containing protein 3-like [Saccoglossus kowalevskii]
MAVYDILESYMSRLFGKYGAFLSKHALIIMSIAIIASGVLGIGLIFQEEETNIEYLYTPENSQASKDREKVLKLFADMSASNFYSHQQATLGVYGENIMVGLMNGDNVLTEAILTEQNELDVNISMISVTVDQQEYGFLDVCSKRSGSCVVDGIQRFINNNEFNGFLSTPILYPTETDNDGNAVYIPDIMGGVTVTDTSHISSAESLRTRYHLRTDGKFHDISLKWERKFLANMKKWQGEKALTSYSTSESLNTELDENTDGDILEFSITFTIMITYASLVCSTGNCVSTRSFLSNFGVIAAALAILASFGFCGFVGVKMVNIVGVMPFLIVAIGIDDMFLLLAGWLETKPSEDVAEKMSHTFSIAAVSVTLTSLTDIIAFALGTINPFPSVRNFCIYTGFAIFWCYLMQLTVFGGALVFHTRRVKASRHAITCQPVATLDEMEKQGRGKAYICMCIGKQEEDPDHEKETVCERVPKKYLPKMILNPVAKTLILIIFAAYLGVAIWGATQLHQGLLLNNLVSPTSYLHDYLRLSEKHYTNDGPMVMAVMEEPLEYWETNIQNDIDALLNVMTDNEYIRNSYRVSWLDSFSQHHGGSLPTDQTTFVDSLQNSFLPLNPRFQGDLNISDGNILASRFYVRSLGFSDTYLEGQMMLQVREIADESHLPVFAYCGAFIYYEQYVQVMPSTLMTLGISMAVMFVVCLIFVPHPLCSVYITVTTAMILTGLLGYMHFWGLSLSSITMMHVIMSVGFCVDYSAHICHAFMKADGFTKNERVAVALSRSHVSYYCVWNGTCFIFFACYLVIDWSFKSKTNPKV